MLFADRATLVMSGTGPGYESDCDEENSDSECDSTCMELDFPATLAGESTEDMDSDRDSDQELGDQEIYTPPSLNSSPDFTPLESRFSTHFAKAALGPDSIDRKRPLAFFKLFCSGTEFDIFAKNTNKYADTKGAGKPHLKRQLPWVHKSLRPWHQTTPKELMVRFGLLIFIGLAKTGAKNSWVHVYWRTDGQVSFAPMKNVSRVRIQQLKRFFHLSTPNLPKGSSWYAKIAPFSMALRDASTRYLFLLLNFQLMK